jgi:hypothetical protein
LIGRRRTKPQWTCTEVKAFIAVYGEAFAITRARMAGLTKADIERIKKRCEVSR